MKTEKITVDRINPNPKKRRKNHPRIKFGTMERVNMGENLMNINF